MSLPNKKFINMDVQEDGKWWVDVLDTSLEHPRMLREIFETESEARKFYDDLLS